MMMTWRIEYTEGKEERVIESSLPFEGEIHIREDLGEGKIKAVTASLPLQISEDDRFFLNGYQTWTYSKEYDREGRERGLSGIPSFIKEHYALSGYGDYSFVPYPNKKGMLHGFSFMSIRKGDKFRLIASLDERNGWTVFFLNTKTQTLVIQKDNKGLKTHGAFNALDLFTAEGSEEEVYNAWFDALKIKSVAKPLAGYSSWYNRYQNISEKTIEEDLEGCKGILKNGDLFQIDDGWECFVGDWRVDEKKFPSGMEAIVEKIHASGFLAGLWLSPFIAEEKSTVFKEHPDWLLRRDEQGNRCGCNWSGFWSLDIDNRELREYLRDVFHTVFDVWKIDLVKLDFLYAAAPWGSEDESRSGRMIRAMEFLREVCKDKLILGCGIPVMAGFGLTDYSRVSCDVTLDWDDKVWMKLIHSERPSTKRALETSFFRRSLNRRAYVIDPDVFFLRDNNIHLSRERKILLAKADALFKGLFLTSDNPSLYTEEMRKDYREIRHIWEEGKIMGIEREKKRTVISYSIDNKTEKLILPF